jgi:hypothetical protein
MSIVKTHNIFINSEYRTSGTISDFTINLKEPLRLMNSNNYFRCKVGRTIIANVINQINASNNVLQYNISRPSVPLSQTANITLSVGNYNINTLLTELSNKLTASIATYSVSIKTNFTYDRTTGKATLGLTGLDTIATTITLYFNNNLRLGAFFGFTSNAVFSYTNTTTSNNTTGQTYVNVNPINHIYIRSSLPQRESYENVIESITITDILAKIPIMSYSSGNFIFYENSISYTDLSINLIDSINLYLSDNLSYSIDMTLNYTTTLIIEEIGTDKSDYVLDNEILTKQKEDEALMTEIQLLKQLIKERKQLKNKKETKN